MQYFVGCYTKCFISVNSEPSRYACNYNGDYTLNVETFYEGTWKLLNNLIYENGFRKAMITAYADGTCGVSDE